jgi:hypothetical protein
MKSGIYITKIGDNRKFVYPPNWNKKTKFVYKKLGTIVIIASRGAY